MKALIAATLLLLTVPAAAVECPKELPTCKVLFLSPQEEQILTQPNGVLATAAEARKVDYAGVVQYLLQRIKDAPSGTPYKQPDQTDAPPPAPGKK